MSGRVKATCGVVACTCGFIVLIGFLWSRNTIKVVAPPKAPSAAAQSASEADVVMWVEKGRSSDGGRHAAFLRHCEVDTSLVARFDDPCDLIRNFADPNMSYGLVCQCIQQNEIEQLHQMLNDENWKAYWPVIATVIGMASQNEQSVPVLMDYFRRDDLTSCKDQFLDFLIMKMSIPQYLGKIGGSHAKRSLMELANEDTFLETIKGWVDSDTVKSHWPNKERLLSHIRANVFYGLVYLQDPEASEFVGKHYLEGLVEYQQTKVDTPMWNNLVYAMGLKDCIDEVGLDEVLNMGYKEKMELTRSYMYKYAPHLKKPMQTRPSNDEHADNNPNSDMNEQVSFGRWRQVGK